MFKLTINSIIDKGRYKGKKISDLIADKKAIFSLIKEGISFDDEVLTLSGIKKNVRDVKVKQVFVEHEIDTNVYAKETASLQKILKEIRTLDNIDVDDTISSYNKKDDVNNDGIIEMEDL